MGRHKLPPGVKRQRRREWERGYRTRPEYIESRVKYRRTPEEGRRVYLRYQYGITPEEVDAMVVEQGGRCLICHRLFVTPHIDHDHSTGLIRGLLCGSCNRAIGLMDENPDALREAAKYLEDRSVR